MKLWCTVRPYYRTMLNLCFLHIVAYLIFIGGSECLKDLRVSIPTAIRKGETAVFLCDFDLEDDQLYAVKWYKGRKEFYRYTPKDEIPIKTFHLDHIHVDKNKSNMTQLTLLRVNPALSGIYNCEVSAESPSFHTILASGDMTVVEIPKQEPTIEGWKQRYKVPESLNVICTAGASRPAANITWFINGDKAAADYVRPLSPLPGLHGELLWSSRSQLNFLVKSHTFYNGFITIRCTASILNIYQSTVELRASEASLIESEIVVLVSKFDTDQDGSSRGSIIWGEQSATSYSIVLLMSFLLNIKFRHYHC